MSEQADKALIDPTRIYESFSCPVCSGTGKQGSLSEDGEDGPEVDCDLCNGDGWVDFANLAVRRAQDRAAIDRLSRLLAAAMPRMSELIAAHGKLREIDAPDGTVPEKLEWAVARVKTLENEVADIDESLRKMAAKSDDLQAELAQEREKRKEAEQRADRAEGDATYMTGEFDLMRAALMKLAGVKEGPGVMIGWGDAIKKIREQFDRLQSQVSTLESRLKAHYEAMHPDYGECDAFADGACSECLKIKERAERAEADNAALVLRLRSVQDFLNRLKDDPGCAKEWAGQQASNDAVLKADHPGAFLLSELHKANAKLDAAKAPEGPLPERVGWVVEHIKRLENCVDTALSFAVAVEPECKGKAVLEHHRSSLEQQARELHPDTRRAIASLLGDVQGMLAGKEEGDAVRDATPSPPSDQGEGDGTSDHEDRLIDPQAIYDPFDCPMCRGSRKSSRFLPEDGESEEIACDFCEGEGFVTFADLAQRNTDQKNGIMPDGLTVAGYGHDSKGNLTNLVLHDGKRSIVLKPELKDQEHDGVSLIAAERKRQVEQEGWSPEHDDEHEDGELALAAACYATPESHRVTHHVNDPTAPQTPRGGVREVPINWPWLAHYWKPAPDDRIRELTKAGALIAAEIDRLRRRQGDDVRADQGESEAHPEAEPKTYVCTKCGWTGSDPRTLGRLHPVCKRCDYMVKDVSEGDDREFNRGRNDALRWVARKLGMPEQGQHTFYAVGKQIDRIKAQAEKRDEDRKWLGRFTNALLEARSAVVPLDWHWAWDGTPELAVSQIKRALESGWQRKEDSANIADIKAQANNSKHNQQGSPDMNESNPSPAAASSDADTLRQRIAMLLPVAEAAKEWCMAYHVHQSKMDGDWHRNNPEDTAQRLKEAEQELYKRAEALPYRPPETPEEQARAWFYSLPEYERPWLTQYVGLPAHPEGKDYAKAVDPAAWADSTIAQIKAEARKEALEEAAKLVIPFDVVAQDPGYDGGWDDCDEAWRKELRRLAQQQREAQS